MHVRGLHHAENHTAARELFEAAAAHDLPAAWNGLGVLHFHGQGVPVNYTLAREYFEKGADRDHDSAYNLGTIHQVCASTALEPGRGAAAAAAKRCRVCVRVRP